MPILCQSSNFLQGIGERVFNVKNTTLPKSQKKLSFDNVKRFFIDITCTSKLRIYKSYLVGLGVGGAQTNLLRGDKKLKFFKSLLVDYCFLKP